MQASDWQSIPEVVVGEGIRRQLITGERVMFVRFQFDAGCAMPAHSHPHEQISYIAAGEVDYRVGDEVRRVGPGGLVVVPPDVMHGVTTLDGPVVAYDCFAPPREDFLRQD